MARYQYEPFPYVTPPELAGDGATGAPVIIVGAGPIGLAAAIDLATHGVASIVVDDNNVVSVGSRAICWAKRSLEIFDRLGGGERMLAKGVTWKLGRVYRGDEEVYNFDLLPEDGHRFPAFINLQQYYFEHDLIARIREVEAQGAPIEIRGGSRVSALSQHADHTSLTVETPDGPYAIEADWVVACDGAGAPTRSLMGLDFVGRVFEDNFLIADVRMDAEFPTERWFWFDPPFNRGQSALLHKQPDGVWRIDLQLGWDIDKEVEKRPENVIPRLKAMLGEDVKFELERVSIYTFQCRRMEKFRHGRVIFAGDSAHQVSPFGARGANSGVQDADNLGWKLAAVLKGWGGPALLNSYEVERRPIAVRNSGASTHNYNQLKSVLDCSGILDETPEGDAVRARVGSAIVSATETEWETKGIHLGYRYEGSPILSPDGTEPDSDDFRWYKPSARPGHRAPHAWISGGPRDGLSTLDLFGDGFVLLKLGETAPDDEPLAKAARRRNLPYRTVALTDPHIAALYELPLVLVRPDGHVAWRGHALPETPDKLLDIVSGGA